MHPSVDQYVILENVDGTVAMIDHEDLERVYKIRWYANIRRGVITGVVAYHEGTTISLHRYLLDANPGDVVDHIDGDPLNCRKANLRFSDHGLNAANRAKRFNSASRFKRVRRSPSRKGSWQMCFMYEGIAVTKTFPTEVEAARAYDLLMGMWWGEYCCTNFPVLVVEDGAVRQLGRALVA